MKKKGEASPAAKKKAASNALKDKKPKNPLSRVFGDKSKARQKNRGLAPYFFGLLFFSLVIIALQGTAMGWLQFGQHQERTAEQLANVQAEQSAALVNVAIRQSAQLAENLIVSPLVLDALQEESASDLMEDHLSSLIPDGRIYLIRQQEQVPRRDLSYNARDIIQKARQEPNNTPMTVMPAETPFVLVAKRATNSQAVVLVEQRLTTLVQQLQSIDLLGGRLEVLVPGLRDPILSRGKPLADGHTAVRNAQYNTSIRVIMAPETGDTQLRILFYSVLVAAAVLILAAISFTLRNMSNAMQSDSKLLSQYIDDLTRPGDTRARGNFSFSSLEQLTAHLDKLLMAITKAYKSKSRSSDTKDSTSDDFSLDIDGDAITSNPFMFEDTDNGDAQADPESQESEEQQKSNELEPLQYTATGTPKNKKQKAASSAKDLPSEIFREYDIRGVVGETLTADIVRKIGQAVASEALEAKQKTIVIARDGRHSSPELADALTEGITAAGCDVINIGAVPTPLLYYATSVIGTESGICITGSHNPEEYNGLKIVIASETLYGKSIQKLRQRIESNKLHHAELPGKSHDEDIKQRYFTAINDDIVMARPMKIVIDCGNGITGAIAPELFAELGCEVIPLFAEVDGSFPNHHPDPGNPDNLADLIRCVQSEQADIGIAFDGDGDRIGIVSPTGEIIWPDRLMMLYARDLLARSPGADIIFDVKCSRELPRTITELGGRPLMWRSGHSLIKAKLKQTGAALAGEMSGHIFFADRWFGFDDALYSAARLLEILSLESDSVDEIFSTLQTGIVTPELIIETSESQKFSLMKALNDRADQFSGSATTIDGLRVDFEDGWGLIRASNTTPRLTLRFEADDEDSLSRIQDIFRQQINAVDGKLKLPF